MPGTAIPPGTPFPWPAARFTSGRTPRLTFRSRRSSSASRPTPGAIGEIHGARVLALLGDSVTTDHISPAGDIPVDGPAGRFLVEHGVTKKDFNSFGSRRGNDRVMVRGTFANIRLKNLLVPGTEGGITLHFPDGERMTIYDAAMRYRDEGVPLIVLAGKEYGSGSSRDWAAKGTLLLGVRAVLAETYERIHRSNLVGMGVLPLQFREGENAATLGLSGQEVFDVSRPERRHSPALGSHRNRRRARWREEDFQSHRPARLGRGSELLPQRRHPAHGAAQFAEARHELSAVRSPRQRPYDTSLQQ